MAVPFGSVGHSLQVDPQAVASLSDEHPLPHWWYPEPQVKVHVPAEHAVLAAPVGLGHGLHEVPQEFGLVS